MDHHEDFNVEIVNRDGTDTPQEEKEMYKTALKICYRFLFQYIETAKFLASL